MEAPPSSDNPRRGKPDLGNGNAESPWRERAHLPTVTRRPDGGYVIQVPDMQALHEHQRRASMPDRQPHFVTSADGVSRTLPVAWSQTAAADLTGLSAELLRDWDALGFFRSTNGLYCPRGLLTLCVAAYVRALGCEAAVMRAFVNRMVTKCGVPRLLIYCAGRVFDHHDERTMPMPEYVVPLRVLEHHLVERCLTTELR